MYATLLKRLIPVLGRVGVILAMSSTIPQGFCESLTEIEAVVVMHSESTFDVEPCLQSSQRDRLHLRLHVPGHRTGQASLIGHDGRRLSATLLAPLRC